MPLISLDFASFFSSDNVILFRSFVLTSPEDFFSLVDVFALISFLGNDFVLTSGFSCLEALGLDPFTRIFSISSSVNAWRCPFLTRYPLRLFFLKTIILSSFKWLKTLASTETPEIEGSPIETFPPSSYKKTLSKDTLDPSFPDNRLTKSFWFWLTLNCLPAISTIAYINIPLRSANIVLFNNKTI